MALHHELPIYKATYDLLKMTAVITRNIPRDFKRLIGDTVREECVQLMVIIFRANVASDKSQVQKTANSYYGLFRMATHSHMDRVNLTHAVFTHGKAVNRQLTKTYKALEKSNATI